MALTIMGLSFSTFVRSVEIMCRYKGLAYKLQKHIDGTSLREQPEKHHNYHPFLKFPVLLDGDLILPESTCIARYLNTKVGKPLLPEDPVAFAQADAWMNHIAIDVDQAIVRNILLEFAFPKGVNGKVRFKKIHAHLPMADYALRQLSKQLAENDYLMGKTFTACDALLIPILDYLAKAEFEGNPMGHYANLKDYIQRMRTLDHCESILISI